jgi:Dehydratase medium subunit
VNEPLVLALVSEDAPVGALRAGFEEEGVPLTVEAARGQPQMLARAAARRSLLGIGIGGDRDHMAVVLAGAPAQPYLRAPNTAARRLGHDAARIAARRPLKLG